MLQQVVLEKALINWYQLKDRNWKSLFQVWRRKPATWPFHHLHALWGSFLRTLLLLLQGSGSHLRPLQALLQRPCLPLSCLWPWGSPSPSEAMVSWSWRLSCWLWMSLSLSHFLISLGNIYQVPLKMHLQGKSHPSRNFSRKSLWKSNANYCTRVLLFFYKTKWALCTTKYWDHIHILYIFWVIH